MERLVLLLQQRLTSGALVLAAPVPDLYVVSRGEAAERAGLALAVALRRLGLAVERDASGSAFGKQLKRAERSGAPWVAVIGEEEVASAQLRLRSLASQQADDQRIPLAALDDLIRMLQ
jgi:histidyl-tRNA synthetase